MTSRERVATALEHRAPDRVPFDCTLTIDAYNALIAYLNLKRAPKTECTLFSTVAIDLELIEAMRLDCAYVTLAPSSRHAAFHFGMGEYTDIWGLTYGKFVMPNGMTNYQVLNAPLKDADVTDLDVYAWPDPHDESLYRTLEQDAECLFKDTDLALIGNFGGSVFTLASLLRGMEQWYVDLVINKDFVNKLLSILAAYYTHVYHTALERCGRYLNMIRIDNDDYGTQNGLLISTQTFRKDVKPLIAEYYAVVKTAFHKQNPQGKIMKHSCGDVSQIIDDFIEMGVDVLDPVQVSASGMNPERLKRQYGERICFHGGIDTQSVLPFGNIDEVQAVVRKTVGILGAAGGYIMSPVHHVEGDVPPQNLVAIRDAVIN